MSRSPFGLVYLAVDEPKGDPKLRARRDSTRRDRPTRQVVRRTTREVVRGQVVRRVRDQNELDELFPVWRYHPFFTNSVESLTAADVTHRRHAVIETVFADLIDGPLAHLPSGRFASNHAWAICAAMT